jgi:FkbM family methyltransferase
MPQAHTNILKKISETFTPNVIYDIGASTLHWTKAAKNIWPNSEFCAFDAIEEAEILYKSKNIKYNIGVISDQDNKIVKFYENKENPAGNSYYKEIGHPNSVNVYPENSYIERKAMTLETVVKRNNFLLPDIVKIDVQGAELDILKGGQTIINNAKYLIIELQNVEYNRGAPLENITIEYLESNGWEIVESKFSNNGPDADYLFINKNYKREVWYFYYQDFNSIETISQFIKNQFNYNNNIYEIIITNNKDEIINSHPHKVTFILNLFDEIFLQNLNDNNCEISILQTEPLNLSLRLHHILETHKKFPQLKIYDYSKSNIKILNQYDITNCEYLAYNINSDERNKLISFMNENKNNKIYDFGFIYNWKSLPVEKQNIIYPPRRGKIINFLRKNGFKINLVAGFDDNRDIELSKCKFILNIHGQINLNPTPSPDECSNIFEHIRCDRLLESGYNILSETSYDLDDEYIKKHNKNLTIINYDDFFDVNIINKILQLIVIIMYHLL